MPARGCSLAQVAAALAQQYPASRPTERDESDLHKLTLGELAIPITNPTITDRYCTSVAHLPAFIIRITSRQSPSSSLFLFAIQGLPSLSEIQTHLHPNLFCLTYSEHVVAGISCTTTILRDLAAPSVSRGSSGSDNAAFSDGVYRRYALVDTSDRPNLSSIFIVSDASGIVELAKTADAFDALVETVSGAARRATGKRRALVEMQDGLLGCVAAVAGRSAAAFPRVKDARQVRVDDVLAVQVPEGWGLVDGLMPSTLVPRSGTAAPSCIMAFPPLQIEEDRVQDEPLPSGQQDAHTLLTRFAERAHAIAGLFANNPPSTATVSAGRREVALQHFVLRGEGRAWEFRVYAAAVISDDDNGRERPASFCVFMFWAKGMAGYQSCKDMFEELAIAAFAPPTPSPPSSPTTMASRHEFSERTTSPVDVATVSYIPSAEAAEPARPRKSSAGAGALFGTTHRATTLEGVFRGSGLGTLRPDLSRPGKTHNPYLTTTLLLTHAREVYVDHVPLDGSLSRFRRTLRHGRQHDGTYVLVDDGDTVNITLHATDQSPSRLLTGRVTDDYTLQFPPAAFGTLAALVLLAVVPTKPSQLSGRAFSADHNCPGFLTFGTDGSVEWSHPSLGGKGCAKGWKVEHFALEVLEVVSEDDQMAQDDGTLSWTIFCTRPETTGASPGDVVVQGVRFCMKREWESG
ncbi:hypothetical protein HKX48_006631 [Thoreauomyces humboldtii]|nr:hypothetical protein HKX48_006631 [Thoreauomyces humboldtii]